MCIWSPGLVVVGLVWKIGEYWAGPPNKATKDRRDKAIKDRVEFMQGIKVYDSQLEDEAKLFLATKELDSIIKLKPDSTYEGPLKDLEGYDQNDM